VGGGDSRSGKSVSSEKPTRRHEENDKALVAQVDRQGCELILSSQWPDKVGTGLIFISLDVGDLTPNRGWAGTASGPIGWPLGTADKCQR
jgi:hypothetical protein